MIQPSNEKKLHPAGYKLTVGEDFALNGQTHRISDEKSPGTRPYIRIEPFQVGIIRTAEALCIPEFVVARWNIVVKRAYEGLLVGAAHLSDYNIELESALFTHAAKKIGKVEEAQKSLERVACSHLSQSQWVPWRYCPRC